MDAPIRPRVHSVMRGAFGGKVTVAFRTRYDVTGLLQVEGVQSNPPGMRIRYKLLHREEADSTVAGSTLASPADVAGFLPEARHSVTAHETLQNCFLDLDSGRILSAPRELTDSLRVKGQLNDGAPQAAFVAEWMRKSGADWMKRKDESGVVQFDGANAIMAEMRPEQNGASRFDTLTPDEIVHALNAQPEPPSTGAHPLWGVSPGRVVAFRTREGATGIAEVLPKPPGSATTQLRYKLVRQPRGAPATSVRSPFPKATHTSDGKRTALLHHDEVDLHYVLFHAGDFGSTVSDSHNTRSQAWTDTGTLTLKNGQTFNYKRESRKADQLQISVTQHGASAAHDKSFDLRHGKVLVLHNNGFVEQTPLYPSLVEALDLKTLAELLTRYRSENAPLFGPRSSWWGTMIVASR